MLCNGMENWLFGNASFSVLEYSIVEILNFESLIKEKGPVKLIERVTIAHSFLHSVSNQFHVIVLSLPM